MEHENLTKGRSQTEINALLDSISEGLTRYYRLNRDLDDISQRIASHDNVEMCEDINVEPIDLHSKLYAFNASLNYNNVEFGRIINEINAIF
jgi:hypothetical protein